MQTHVPRSVEAIVNEQVRRWLLEQARRSEVPREREPWPIVALSREFGSLGAKLAEQLAERLGFSFWDQELVHEIAARTGLREAFVATLDEHVKSRVDDFVASLVTGPDASAAEYARQLALVVHTIDRHGNAVVVGRGAQYILAPERALRVRIVCAFERRVHRHAERLGIAEREARRQVAEIDHEREAFHRRHYHRDVTDPHDYDLVLNTGTMPSAAALDVVLAAYRAKFGRLPALLS